MSRKHAIVIGAGIAGLGTARVLSNYFEKVTMIERDCLSTLNSKQGREGVPQGNHAHALLTSGFRILKKYFPTLESELIAEGAIIGDPVYDIRFFFYDAWMQQAKSDLNALGCSRPYLESKIRQHLVVLPNVNILENYNVMEPIFDPKLAKVTGVKIEHAERDEDTSVLEADWVIDATGRGTRASQWLSHWGFRPPEESKINADVFYSTFRFERRPGDIGGCSLGLGVIGGPAFPKRAGVVIAVEGNQWLVTLTGRLGDYPPTDLNGFREFARSLPAPDIYEFIKDRQPVGQAVEARLPSYRRPHYEMMSDFPRGYLVIGDALCNFNPLQALGMSAALGEVKILDECLAQGDENLAQRYFKKISEFLDTPWGLSLANDLLFPEIEFPRPTVGFLGSLHNRYMNRLLQVIKKDPVVLRRFTEVGHLIQPPAALFAPNIVWRVLIGGKSQ